MASRKVKLDELKVADLRRELEERDLDTTGPKVTLKNRLREVLEMEGIDVSNYLFEVPYNVDAMLQKLIESSAAMQQKIQEASAENMAAIQQKFQEASIENSAAMAAMQQKLQEASAENMAAMQQKFQEASTGISAAMSTMEQKILDNLEQKLAENEKIVEDRFESLESRMGNQATRMNELEMNVSKLEHAISKLNSKGIQPPEPTNEANVNEFKGIPGHEEEGVLRTEPAKTIIKPPQFDGTTSWNNYFLQFEAAARANAWSNGDRVTALILALRGEATAILETLSAEERTDYRQLVKRLEMRYGQANFEHVYHSQLRSRYQKSNESLQQFEADVARLVRLAYPGTPEDVLERLAVQSFLDGLRDSEMRQALTLARPTKLVDALTRALEFEAAKRFSRNQAHVRMVQEDFGRDVEEIQGVRRISEKRKQIRCWNCGKEGHVRSRCKEERGAATSELAKPSEN